MLGSWNCTFKMHLRRPSERLYNLVYKPNLKNIHVYLTKKKKKKKQLNQERAVENKSSAGRFKATSLNYGTQ